MKLIRTLPITSKQFYDLFEEEMKKHEAVEIKTGTKITSKGNDQYTDVTYEILEYQRNHKICFKMKTFADYTITTYHTKTVEKGLEVTYEQYIDSFETSKKNRFFAAFSKAVYLGRMSDQLYDMVAKINQTQSTPKLIQMNTKSEHELIAKLYEKNKN